MNVVGYLKKRVRWEADRWVLLVFPPDTPTEMLPRYAGGPTRRTITRVPVIQAAIRCTHTTRGRSAATFHWQVAGGRATESTLAATADLLDAIQRGELVLRDGYFRGTYTFAKRGSSITLRVAKPDEWERTE